MHRKSEVESKGPETVRSRSGESYEAVYGLAKEGNPAAAAALGRAMVNGANFPDAEEVFGWVKADAEGGDPDAMLVLSLMYGFGIGTEKDEQASERLIEMAATGSAEAAIMIGAGAVGLELERKMLAYSKKIDALEHTRIAQKQEIEGLKHARRTPDHETARLASEVNWARRRIAELEEENRRLADLLEKTSPAAYEGRIAELGRQLSEAKTVIEDNQIAAMEGDDRLRRLESENDNLKRHNAYLAGELRKKGIPFNPVIGHGDRDKAA